MTIASAILSRVCYVAEVTRGTTPTTPSMKTLRLTKKNINGSKEELESEEARADRETQDYRHGFRSVGGTLGGELSLTSYDDWLEAALGGAWAAGTSVDPIGADGTAETFTRATGSFITDGYRPGDIVIVAGFTAPANNGQHRVTAVAAGTLTVTTNLTTEAAAGGKSVNLVGKRVQTGTTLKTFTVERAYPDLPQYEVFRGVCVNALKVEVKPKQISKVDFDLLGMDFDPMTATPLDASPDAASTTNPMNAFDGQLYEGGTLIGVVTGVDLMLSNNRTSEGVVGSAVTPDLFEGPIKTSGTLTVLFQDATLYNKFRNETESTLWLRIQSPDDSTAFINVVLPRIKYMGADTDPPRQGPVIRTFPIRALPHATYGTSVWLQRSNA